MRKGVKKTGSIAIALMITILSASWGSEVIQVGSNCDGREIAVSEVVSSSSFDTSSTESVVSETSAEAVVDTVSETTVSETPVAEPEPEQPAQPEWTEESCVQAMYTTEPCFQREQPIVGSKVMQKLKKGKAVNVITKTSSGYYGVEGGGYIHSDFLTDKAPAAPAQKPKTESQPQSSEPAKPQAPSVVNDGTVKGIINSSPLNPRQTGFAYLDQKVQEIFNQIFTPDMDTYDQVKACYDYLIHTVSYKSVSYPTAGFGSMPQGSDNYIAWAAQSVFDTNLGTCNRYSAAFIVMTRAIGLDSRYASGQTSAAGGGFTGHVWVDVVIGGQTYIFDPQVEDNMTKGGNIQYLRFCKTLSQVPNKYIYE